ncbi:fumarylacetoacetate hydrolase family protein [Rhizorhabdus sp. FW153]|uniref:fumarylacetoacetate hydrolase family protein n=1 Tax=Rhizorhabdus sp. FW153 TaxID=3400216 RepID=UPI003CEAF6F8
MRLATRHDGTPDGQLVVISANGEAFRTISGWSNLLDAITHWNEAEPALQAAAAALAAEGGDPLDLASLSAPMPRSWQWLDGSAFNTHGELMQIAFGLDPVDASRPLMYQGMSDRFLAPHADVPVPDEGLGIDFEGEFGVIVDAVPMGVSSAEAAQHIRLIVQINDWSLRAIAPIEMKTGFGWVQAKPACSMAPFAVTPDELGPAWRDGRVCMDLVVEWNGRRFGRVNGDQMAFSLPELVAHAARTRDLVAGTIIGTGTVSNAEYAQRGSACISEKRAIEIIAHGAPRTPFMAFGDEVAMFGLLPDERRPFGTISQKVVQA